MQDFPQTGNVIRLGEKVDVALEVESRNGGGYLLLEDPIPAGMEYQAPGLEATGGQEYYAGYVAGHLEARDDRVAIFATRVPAVLTKFGYTLRAGTRGRFLARPAGGGNTCTSRKSTPYRRPRPCIFGPDLRPPIKI